ncbi:MAG: hypothetical protein EOP54_25805, partial [Sphingobacteriales bacterium]
MTKLNCAVVIPFYKPGLSPNEMVSLQQCFKVLANHPIIAIKPEGLVLPTDTDAFKFKDVISFDNSFFKGIAGYNRLMLSAELYGAFLNYDYILIHQLDAFVFSDDLKEWCGKDIDYVGAPWIAPRRTRNKLPFLKASLRYYLYRYVKLKKTGLSHFNQLENRVGNGGFSLRRVKKFYNLCTTLAPQT